MVSKRKVGPFSVHPIGFGCMCISQGYGPLPAEADAAKLLHRALDAGYDFLDTAAIYGNGHNESLIGRTLKARRGEFVLASKCGMRLPGRELDGSPEGVAATLDDSLRRLDTEHIDLYYLHRPDPKVAIEDSVGALMRAKEAGKIGAIGLSEVSAETLRRAQAIHPIAALQTEYSLWTRNPEIAVLDACRELDISFVAFSPVGRGFLAGATRPHPQGDMRAEMPRFIEPNLSSNLKLLARLKAMADDIGCTTAQLSIAWLLHKDDALVTIPGTTSIAHLEENMASQDVLLDDAQVAALDAMINEHTVRGGRYNDWMQATVTTENFA